MSATAMGLGRDGGHLPRANEVGDDLPGAGRDRRPHALTRFVRHAYYSDSCGDDAVGFLRREAHADNDYP